MNATRSTEPQRRRWPDGLRWALCFVLAIAFHAAGAAALVARWNESAAMPPGAPVVMIDLAPVAAAPDTTPKEVPPDTVESKLQEEPEPTPDEPKIEPPPEEPPVEQVKLEPEPEPEPLPPDPEPLVEKLDLPPIPKAEVTLPVAPPERPKPKPKRKRQVSEARTKSSADQLAARAAAPLPNSSARDSNAVPTWKSLLSARLERYKQYPSDARDDSGSTLVAFSIDRNGGAHGVRVVRSSGSSALDRESVAVVHRAQPLPPPPPEMGGGMISITVPIRYKAR